MAWVIPWHLVCVNDWSLNISDALFRFTLFVNIHFAGNIYSLLSSTIAYAFRIFSQKKKLASIPVVLVLLKSIKIFKLKLLNPGWCQTGYETFWVFQRHINQLRISFQGWLLHSMLWKWNYWSPILFFWDLYDISLNDVLTYYLYIENWTIRPDML